MQGCICGVICSKLIRPGRRQQEVIFSEKATIHQNEDRQQYFTFRMSNPPGGHLVQVTVRLYLAEKMQGFLNELMPMKVTCDGAGILLIWPTIVTHVIDQDSPLYGFGKGDLQRTDIEIIAVVEGVLEATGMAVQARTSYVPCEILWGHK